jgi:carbonic anhydrase/acetyltransferase-like protein (isoleucine patch superfamily)
VNDIVDQDIRSTRLNFRNTADVVREAVYQRSSALRRFLGTRQRGSGSKNRGPETFDLQKRATPGGVIYRLGSLFPELAETVFVADGARIIGQVTMGPESSVWFGAVMRGDNGPIRIGNGSNVQDCAILHSHPGGRVALGAFVSVGHQSIIHGCTIADRVLIGMQAVIMDGVELAEDTIVAAGSVIPMHKKFPPGVLLQGTPAKVVRQLSGADIAYIERNALEYVERSRRYARELARA